MMAPFDFAQARQASDKAAEGQEEAEKAMRKAAKDAAEKERSYRVALAQELVRLHDQDGVAWTVCADLARGDEKVSDLRAERDIAQGALEASKQAAWRRSADRRDTHEFIGWSMRRELAENPPLRSAA